MDRARFHKILDKALDIAELGFGDNGFPFVKFEVSNYPVCVDVVVYDTGFESGKPVDGKYTFVILGAESERKYQTCIKHLEELKERAEGFFK